MLILKNAKVLTMAAEDFEKGDVAIHKGRIKAVAAQIVPTDDDEVIDCSGKWLMPGIIDAHCHLGMWEDSMGFEGADGNEATDPITPQLRAIDSVNPFDRGFADAREAGITTVVTGPGSANVIGGQFAALKTAGRSVDEMILRAPAALKVAFGENPKRVYHEQNKMPSTRMATAALLREAFVEAQEYSRKLEQGGKDLEKLPERSLKMDIMLQVLNREIPLKAHAHRADDILTAIRIAKEFDCDYSIDHCTEGYLITDLLKEEKAKIIIGPMLGERSKIELKNMTFKSAKILADAGIKFALMTDHPVIPIQYLPLEAALAVKEGLDEMTALKAITIHAAEITGIDDHVGSIEVGKDADIAVFSGNPLDLRTKAELVLINGVIVHDARV